MKRPYFMNAPHITIMSLKSFIFLMCSTHKLEHEYDICFHICIPFFTVTDIHM